MKTHQRTRLASAVLAAASGFSMLALTLPAEAGRDIQEDLQDEIEGLGRDEDSAGR